VLVAPGGHGTTEVLDALCDAIASEDGPPPPVRVNGRRLDQAVPFGALAALFDSPPEPGGDVEEPARNGVRAQLDAGATIVVDDAQWLDPGTVRVLVSVADAATERIALVVGHRPVTASELSTLDAALARHGPIVRVESLTETETAERTARLLDAAVDDALVDALMMHAEGVPLFVDALVRAWQEADVVERGGLRHEPGAVPKPVVELVRTRVDQLDHDARRLVTVLSLGSALDDELTATLAGLEPGALGAATASLGAAGLLVPGHDELLPVVADSVVAITPDADRRLLHSRLAEALGERGDPPGRAAEHLVAAGATGASAAATLVAAGDAVLAETPALAAEWFDRAVDAGADPTEVAGRRAEAAALTGDLDAAVELADAALETARGAERARAVAVLAGVLGARGLWGRATQLLASVEGHPDVADAAFALLGVPGQIALGRSAEADAAFDRATDALTRPAPLAVEAAVSFAAGVRHAGRGDGDAALGAILEAAELLESRTVRLVLPDTPHALGATVAVALGDFGLADHLLGRAVDREIGGRGLATRHRLLLGWVALRAGRWAQAEHALDETKDLALATRDQLLRSALDAGLARRNSDVTRLAGAWDAAEPALLRAQPDLFSLEVVGELAIAAARFGAAERATPKLAEVATIVDGLGAPALWALPLAWTCLDAAVTAGDVGATDAQADVIESLPPAHPRLAALAPAARAWAALLGGEFDSGAVEEAAAGLSEAGLAWEASRLTGQAAIRATDPSVTRSLLGRARDLKGTLPATESAAGTSGSLLSEREREVAACVLEGLTHKEIGAQLFISPKTVEHHVAKIRQKLGATTRAEMLAALRAQGE